MILEASRRLGLAGKISEGIPKLSGPPQHVVATTPRRAKEPMSQSDRVDLRSLTQAALPNLLGLER
jgi:hypothetical protein